MCIGTLRLLAAIRYYLECVCKVLCFSFQIKESLNLMALAFQGLGYYQNYDRFLLGYTTFYCKPR